MDRTLQEFTHPKALIPLATIHDSTRLLSNGQFVCVMPLSLGDRSGHSVPRPLRSRLSRIPLLVSVIGGSLWRGIFQSLSGSACDLLLGYQPILPAPGSGTGAAAEHKRTVKPWMHTARFQQCRHAAYIHTGIVCASK